MIGSYADETFDGVILDNVLEHVPAEGADSVVEEVRRVLRREGTVVIGVPGRKGFDADLDDNVSCSETSLESLLGRHSFAAQKVFYMPLAYQRLESVFSQFCVYSVFHKVDRSAIGR